MALSPTEVNDYFKTQNSSATPLSPAQYEATLRTPAPAPIPPAPVTPQPTGGALPGADISKQGQPGYDVFGNKVATPTGSTGGGGTPTAAQGAQTQIDTLNTQSDTAFNNFNNYVTGMRNSSIPLSAGEQAQVDALTQEYKKMIDEQKAINNSSVGLAQMRGAQSGSLEYDANFQNNIIGNIVSRGADKVNELTTKMAGAVASLTMSLRNNDISQARSQWQDLQDYTKNRKAELQKTIDDAQKAIKDAQDQKNKENEAAAKVAAETEKTKSDVLLKLGQSGTAIPAEVYDAVKKAVTGSDAVMAAGNYLYSEADKLDAQYKKAQIAKAYSDIQANSAVGGGDAASTLAYAQQYAATGQIPAGLPKGTFGAVAQVAKELPKSPGQILSTSTGVTPTGDTALQQAMGSLYSATELAKQLKELDQKRWDGIIAGTLGTVFGSADQKRYDDLRAQVVDLISRARSGAALTANEEARYESMLPGHFAQPFGLGVDTQVRIDNFINALTSDMKNKAASQGWAINGISTVKVGNAEYKVGDVVQSPSGQQGRINADGSITLL